jgi:hypothetical protein
MGEPGKGVERELEESERRIVGALERLPASRVDSVASRVSCAAESAAAKVGQGTGRSLARTDRRYLQRLRKEEEASLPSAFALGVAALFTVPARVQPESPAVAAITARESRVDGICDRLLAELEGAPPLVRELLRKPEETIAALRSASRERTALSARVESTSDAVGLVRERPVPRFPGGPPPGGDALS